MGEVLGEGNFAVVKRCKARVTEVEYAMKVISKSKMKGKEEVVENELRILRSCRHVNIVRLIESYETKTEFYVVMELVEVRLIRFPLLLINLIVLFRSFINSFIQSFVRSFINSFIHSFGRSFILSVLRSCIRSFVHFISSHSVISKLFHSHNHCHSHVITIVRDTAAVLVVNEDDNYNENDTGSGGAGGWHLATTTSTIVVARCQPLGT